MNRKSVRLKNYDYTSAGAYFVTICTHQKQTLFGDVTEGNMRLNDYGNIIKEEWYRTAHIRQEIELDEFIIMPNHVHGVVWIHLSKELVSNETVGARGPSPLLHQMQRPMGTGKKSLGSFVGGFKSVCTKHINELRQTPSMPVWQRNYYERIVRNEDELNAIRSYIENNPKTWDDDEENQ